MKPHRSKLFASVSFMPSDIKFNNQSASENVLMFLRQHRIILFPPFFWSFIGALIPLFIRGGVEVAKNYNFDLTFGLPGGIWMALAVLWYFFLFAYLFQTVLSWYFNAYVMTNERLIDFDFEGLLNHGADETNLNNIQTAESAIGGLWGTVFNMGIITVRTSADINNFKLDNIPNPNKVRDFIMDYVVNLHKDKLN